MHQQFYGAHAPHMQDNCEPCSSGFTVLFAIAAGVVVVGLYLLWRVMA